MQRANTHIVGIDLHTMSVTPHCDIAQFISKTAIVKIDAIPLTTHYVIAYLTNNMVETIATQGDRLVLSALCGEATLDHHRCLIME